MKFIGLNYDHFKTDILVDFTVVKYCGLFHILGKKGEKRRERFETLKKMEASSGAILHQ